MWIPRSTDATATSQVAPSEAVSRRIRLAWFVQAGILPSSGRGMLPELPVSDSASEEHCHDASSVPNRACPRVSAGVGDRRRAWRSAGRPDNAADQDTLRSREKLRRRRSGLETKALSMAIERALLRRHAAGPGALRCPDRSSPDRAAASGGALPGAGNA